MLVFAKLCVFCEICKISLDPSPGVDSIFFRIEVYSVGADIYERVFAACWQDVVVKGHMAVPCRAGSGEVNVEVCGGETRASIFVNGQRYFYRLVFLSSCPSCSPLAPSPCPMFHAPFLYIYRRKVRGIFPRLES